MQLTCPACDRENDGTALFCVACGRPLAEGEAAGGLVGKEILGTYRLVELLGQGGMSVVYRARHMLTDQEVAVKVLPPELSTQREVKARFIEEARTLARLEHPNIVSLHNFVESEGFLYLVMQCAEGETWDAVIAREGRVEPAEAVAVVIEVLRALEYAHEQGVIHRDIKPSNIIIRGDDTVKVMDFGIAKFMGSTKLTQTGQTMGTVRYMSPEQVRGKQVDHRSDLYSLGVALYEAVAGRTPFDGDTHFDIMRKHLAEAPPPPSSIVAIPPELEQVLLKSMAKALDQRFQTAREFRHALQRVPVAWRGRRTGRVSVQLAPVGSESEQASRPRRRSHRLFPIALAAGLLIVSGGAVLWAVLDPGKRPGQAPAGRAKPGPSVPVADTERLVPPKPHRVARLLEWKADKTYAPPVALRVMSMRDRDLDPIKDLYLRARGLYPQFLKEEGMSIEAKVGPLNLAIVGQAVLNNKAHWPDVKAHVTYPTRYLAPTATLYVNDSPGFMQTDLPYGLALHFCARIAQLSNERCLELAEGFELYLRKQK
jgi:tRNA A-37 threonylcarbamoyl transferase component Bud32